MRLPLIFLLLVPFVLRAASPAFTDFDTNQFGTNGNKVEIKSGASITNAALTTPILGAATALTINTGQGANELYDMDQNVLTTSSPTFGGMTLSPNGLLNIVWTNLATTPLAGLTLSNATPATAGVTVQDSPALHWQGNAWLTGSLSNAPIVFRAYVVPASAAATPTGLLNINASANGAAFGTSFTIDQGANISASSITAAGGSSINWNGRARMTSSADGVIEFNNNVTSARATAQFNIPQVTKTANWTNFVALESGLRFVNIGAGGAITNFLPTAVAGQRYFFALDAAQVYSIKAAGTDVIHNVGTPTSAGGDIWSSTQYSTLGIFCQKAGHWIVEMITGTWAVN